MPPKATPEGMTKMTDAQRTILETNSVAQQDHQDQNNNLPRAPIMVDEAATNTNLPDPDMNDTKETGASSRNSWADKKDLETVLFKKAKDEKVEF